MTTTDHYDENIPPTWEMVYKELLRAVDDFPPFRSAHEGFAILNEEVDELWEEVKKNPTRHPDRAAKMRKEATQVAAMAMRFLIDVNPS